MCSSSPNLRGKMTSPRRPMITSWTTISTTISDPNLFTTILHKLMNKQTYIGMLRQGKTGNELLAILDMIQQDDAGQPIAVVSYGQSEEINF